jgi:hypothetical protein
MDFHNDPQYQMPGTGPKEERDSLIPKIIHSGNATNAMAPSYGNIVFFVVIVAMVFGLPFAGFFVFRSILGPNPVEALLNTESVHFDIRQTVTTSTFPGLSVNGQSTGATTIFQTPHRYEVRQTVSTVFDEEKLHEGFRKEQKRIVNASGKPLSSAESEKEFREYVETMKSFMGAASIDKEYRKTEQGQYVKMNNTPLLGDTRNVQGKWVEDTSPAILGLMNVSGTGYVRFTTGATKSPSITKEKLLEAYNNYPFLKKQSIADETTLAAGVFVFRREYVIDSHKLESFADVVAQQDIVLARATGLAKLAEHSANHDIRIVVWSAMFSGKITGIEVFDSVSDGGEFHMTVRLSDHNSTITVQQPEEVLSVKEIAARPLVASYALGAYANEPDSDNDGLSDIQEAGFSTNPNKRDSDGDGHDDATEIVNNYSPTTDEGLAQAYIGSTNDEKRVSKNVAVQTMLTRKITERGNCPVAPSWDSLVQQTDSTFAQLGLPFEKERPVIYARSKTDDSCFVHIRLDRESAAIQQIMPAQTVNADAYIMAASNRETYSSITCGGASVCVKLK